MVRLSELYTDKTEVRSIAKGALRKQRLDKVLVHLGIGSRSEVQKLLKQGKVLLNGTEVRDPSLQIEAEGAELVVDGMPFVYREFVYYMLNKPAGLISASRGDEIVIDMLDTADRRPGLFPVGRLDKDSEGLLLISNDGALAHFLLSPKRHVPKRYYVEVEGQLGDREVEAFQRGLLLDEDELCLPAELILPPDEAFRGQCQVVLREGKYHQVKRMMERVGCSVTYLKRIAFGPLQLDPLLEPGCYRHLTEKEIAALREATTSQP